MALSTAISRREVLRAALGASMATLACNLRGANPRPLPEGELVDIGGAHAHRWLREGLGGGAASLGHDFTRAPSRTAQVVIVGAGIAGLSAAWRLARAGIDDLAIVEVDVAPGGTARSGHGAAGPFPWGAHYVVMPGDGFDAFEQLLTELGAIEGKDGNGRPIARERVAYREPAERHFRDGRFHPGLYPLAGETADERAQRERLARLLGELGHRRDDDGRPWFALPQARASRCEAVLALDRISFAHWLDHHGFSSWRLRWLCEYACRDDYGCTLADTSARAGLMYFCARLSPQTSDLDGGRAVLTWPEGNGRIVAHLLMKSRAQVLCERACVRVASCPANTGRRPRSANSSSPIPTFARSSRGWTWHGLATPWCARRPASGPPKTSWRAVCPAGASMWPIPISPAWPCAKRRFTPACRPQKRF